MFKAAVATIVERQGFISVSQVREILSVFSRKGKTADDPDWNRQLYQRVRQVAVSLGKICHKEGDKFYFISPGDKVTTPSVEEVVARVLGSV